MDFNLVDIFGSLSPFQQWIVILSPLVVALFTFIIKLSNDPMITRKVMDTVDALKKDFANFQNENRVDHKRIFVLLDQHDETLDRYSSNEEFYKLLEKAAEDGFEFFSDLEKDTIEFNEKEIRVLSRVVSFMVKSTIDFYRDISVLGLDDTSKDAIASKFANYSMIMKRELLSILRSDFVEKFFVSLNKVHAQFLEEILEVTDDNINDKENRFRDVVILFLRKRQASFIREYGKYRKEKRQEKQK